MKILVYIQQDEGKINSVSLEALKGAQDIAAQTNGTVSALSFNADVCSQLAGYDVAEVLVVEDDNLNTFNPLLGPVPGFHTWITLQRSRCGAIHFGLVVSQPCDFEHARTSDQLCACRTRGTGWLRGIACA